jgi:hypothetical protein
MSKKKLYAFIKFDHAPYLFGGEILKTGDDGRVYIDGYDNGLTSFFTKDLVELIVPYEEGIKLQEKLDIAEKEYRTAVSHAEQKLRGTVQEIKNYK